MRGTVTSTIVSYLDLLRHGWTDKPYHTKSDPLFPGAISSAAKFELGVQMSISILRNGRRRDILTIAVKQAGKKENPQLMIILLTKFDHNGTARIEFICCHFLIASIFVWPSLRISFVDYYCSTEMEKSLNPHNNGDYRHHSPIDNNWEQSGSELNVSKERKKCGQSSLLPLVDWLNSPRDRESFSLGASYENRKIKNLGQQKNLIAKGKQRRGSDRASEEETNSRLLLKGVDDSNEDKGGMYSAKK